MISEHPYLKIDVARSAQAHTIVLSGEADLQSSPRIQAAIEEAAAARPGLVVIDLSSLTFIDSTGLHALASAHELCRARRQELRLVPGPENVQRIFRLTGMDKELPFYEEAPGGGWLPGALS